MPTPFTLKPDISSKPSKNWPEQLSNSERNQGGFNLFAALPDMQQSLPVQVMMEMMDQPIHFHPWCAKLVGSAVGGLWLSYALRRTQRLIDPMLAWDEDFGASPLAEAVDTDKAWFDAAVAQVTQETGLSRFEQQAGKRAVKAMGLMDEKLVGIPARKLYRLNMPHMMSLLQGQIEQRRRDVVGSQ